MRLLPDTHAFLWFLMGDPRLSPAARSAIERADNQKFFSAASAWEIAVKVSLGKLTLGEPYHVLLPREIARNGFDWLPISLAHTAAVVDLPFHHRDPFDRMLVAQARIEAMPIIGVDAAFDSYGVQRIW